MKTGTPPRLLKESIDFSVFGEQVPDEPPIPFSFATEKIERPQISCFIAHTNENTHAALREGFNESPMFLGRITPDSKVVVQQMKAAETVSIEQLSQVIELQDEDIQLVAKLPGGEG